MEITVTWIFGALVSAIGVYVSWSLKRFTETAEANRIEMNAKIGKLEDKLNERYLLKEDHYRQINRIDQKIETLRENVGDLIRGSAQNYAEISALSARITEFIALYGRTHP
jgi:predicted Holliday junction resolvase-like endonuclease